MTARLLKICAFSLVGLLVLQVLEGARIAEASSAYQWPDFQARLRAGPSNSPVKAKPPVLPMVPAAAGTPAELASYGGVWEGWRCRNRTVDLIVVVTRVTSEGADVGYAAGGERFGNTNVTLSAKFEGDVLRARFPRGAELILGMREDGNMNVKVEWQNGNRWCTGILRRSQASPRIAQSPPASNQADRGVGKAPSAYRWPDFQARLRAGPSNSPVKAKTPALQVVPAAAGTPAELAKFGGAWEGWMCRNRSADLKFVVTKVMREGAEIGYAYGSKRFGNFNRTLSGRFEGDVLRARFPNGAELILGMRDDGHMNVKFERLERNVRCAGILRRAGVPRAGQGSILTTRYGDDLPMTVYFPERGSGPFPVVVFNHGRPFGNIQGADYTRSRQFPLISRLNGEGIVVALPVRSGYAPGAGEDGERIRCNNPAGYEFRYAISWARADIADAVRKVKTLPNIDAERVFVGGSSAGGFASGGSMAVLEGKAKGIFVLNGGRCGKRGRLFNGHEYAAEIFSKAAAKSSIPIVFYASEHDTVIPPPSTRGLYEATCEARGPRCKGSVFFVDVYGANHSSWRTTANAADSILSFIARGKP